MRINQYLASVTDLSRRKADEAVGQGRVEINGVLAQLGDTVIDSDKITLDGRELKSSRSAVTILFNKPVGYVCSRAGQGSKTIYDLLPKKYQHLNPVGRLDKNSSGLLLLTSDGELANRLTHPRYGKTKKYEVEINKPLEPLHQQILSDNGVMLEDGPSRLGLKRLDDTRHKWRVTMSEGRNRQIRRTFASLGYRVTKLHRTDFGPYRLGELAAGKIQDISTDT